MDNEISKAIKRKTDAQMRMNATDVTPVVNEGVGNTTIINDPSKYIIPMVAGQNVTIGTSGSNKVINALMNILAGDNITVTEPDENGAVTVSSNIGGKAIDLTGLADGYVLKYDLAADKFVLGEGGGISEVQQATETTLGGIKAKARTTENAEVAIDGATGKLYAPESGGSYTLPQADATTLGGIKAKEKTSETMEVAIESATGKLFVPAPDEAANGIPAGGAAGQILSKVDVTDYNTQWVNASSGGGLSKSHVGSYFMTPPTSGLGAREIVSQRFVPLENITATSVKVAIFNMTGRLRLMIYKASAWKGGYTNGDLIYSGSYENLSASPPCVHTFPAMSVALTEGQIYSFVIESETGATLQGSNDFDLAILGYGSLLPASALGGYGTRASSTINQYSASTITMQVEYS